MDTLYIILIVVAAILVAVGVVVLASFISSKKQGLSPKESYIKTLLPGIDCGSCGCKNCAEFAERVASGELQANACRVNTFANREKLKRHLVRPLEENIKNVAIVKCKGGNRCANKYDYIGEKTCSASEALHSGIKACKAGCIGCGDCVKACPFGAIEISETGAAIVNEFKCTGCGECVSSCPNNLIAMIPSSQQIGVICNNTFDDAGIAKSCSCACIRCEECKRICPHGAITMQNGLPVIDPSKCTACGKCVAVCPTHVISHL
ncbi:MAG: 4Fe-4S binding protein [Clostridia bacterium]|nr:4Fe-4S binding protein [Clostridia bacterium]